MAVRMDDWQTKVLLGLIPVAIAGSGWILSLESRIQVIDARQQERTARFDALEKSISRVTDAVMDPRPKPETRVEMNNLSQDLERMKDEVGKINERINNLHTYITQIPSLRPQAPYAPGVGRRGDLILEYPQRQP